MILRHMNPNVLSRHIARGLSEIKQLIFLIHSPGDLKDAYFLRNSFILEIFIVFCIQLGIGFHFLDIFPRT